MNLTASVIGKNPNPDIKTPRPHQCEATNALLTELKSSDRATGIMACGTGKSLVSLWVAEQLNSKTILVLVPSLPLISQLMHEWVAETSLDHYKLMCVCSDQSVGDGIDELVINPEELDFAITTDSWSVYEFMAEPFDGVKIVFATYQSAPVIAEGMSFDVGNPLPAFELAILDEAHKTANANASLFNFALDDSNLKIDKRLFMTATPRHYGLRKGRDEDAVIAYSMDNPQIYGNVAYHLSFKEAVRLGIICDYKIVISVVTTGMVNEEVLKNNSVNVGTAEVNARQVAQQIALTEAVRKYDVNHIFTFHSSVAAAASFTADSEHGLATHLPDFETYHVSGAMPTAIRNKQMQAFITAEKAAISNARCLTEGVDVPGVDMVVFNDKRKSKVDIVQITGRAMRLAPGKEYGYIMVPLFVEQALNETIEEALIRTGYNDIWDVLNAMRDQDDALVDAIRRIRQEKGRSGHYDASELLEHIEILGPQMALVTIRDSITSRCVDEIGSTWDERLGELIGYIEQHGHMSISEEDIAANEKLLELRIWLGAQRQAYKLGVMSPSKVSRLEDAGVILDINQFKWMESFNALVAYQQEHGSSPPKKHALYKWGQLQRNKFNAGELSEVRLERLRSIDFEFTPYDSKWNKAFALAKAFYQANGHLDMPNRYEQDGVKVGDWIGTQRKSMKAGTLAEDKQVKLESIGMVWGKLESRWNDAFNKLVEFQQEHGYATFPAGKSKEGLWLSGQMERFDELSEDHKQKLASIGVDGKDTVIRNIRKSRI